MRIVFDHVEQRSMGQSGIGQLALSGIDKINCEWCTNALPDERRGQQVYHKISELVKYHSEMADRDYLLCPNHSEVLVDESR